MKQIHRVRVNIPGSTIRRFDRMMMDGGVDYAAEGFGKYETVFRRTATFDDGCEADLKVNTNCARPRVYRGAYSPRDTGQQPYEAKLEYPQAKKE